MTVLDTSVLIAAFERRESPATRALVSLLLTGEPPSVSSLTVAELLRGAAGEDALAARYEAVLDACAVHDVTEDIARSAAALAAASDARGLPARERPGLVDAAIGALALELDAEILSTDPHFRALPGLRLTILPEADS